MLSLITEKHLKIFPPNIKYTKKGKHDIFFIYRKMLPMSLGNEAKLIYILANLFEASISVLVTQVYENVLWNLCLSSFKCFLKLCDKFVQLMVCLSTF